MIKFISETFTNIGLISLVTDESFLQAITEMKNIAVIVVVRVLWALLSWTFKVLKERVMDNKIKKKK